MNEIDKRASLHMGIQSKLFFFNHFVLDKFFKKILIFLLGCLFFIQVFVFFGKKATSTEYYFVCLFALALLYWFLTSTLYLFLYNKENSHELDKKLYQKFFDKLFLEDAILVHQFIKNNNGLKGYEIFSLRKKINDMLNEQDYEQKNKKYKLETKAFKDNIPQLLLLKEKEEEILNLKQSLKDYKNKEKNKPEIL